MKQQHAERRRGLKVLERLDQLRSEEKEKISNGKKPFYLKPAAVRDIALEEK